MGRTVHLQQGRAERLLSQPGRGGGPEKDIRRRTRHFDRCRFPGHLRNQLHASEDRLRPHLLNPRRIRRGSGKPDIGHSGILIALERQGWRGHPQHGRDDIRLQRGPHLEYHGQPLGGPHIHEQLQDLLRRRRGLQRRRPQPRCGRHVLCRR